MASIPKKRSLADMQHATSASAPQDFNDVDYAREVLQLDGATETAMDEAILHEANKLGIDLSGIEGIGPNGHVSISDSDATVSSGHLRSGSTDSDASASTGLTSTASTNDQFVVSVPLLSRKKTSMKRLLSLSEYDKFLAQIAMQQQSVLDALAQQPTLAEPAPSVFSISTRKSYNGLKNGIKRRLGLRRKAAIDLGPKFCVCCCDEFKINKALNALPCSHEYCDNCLRVLLKQASSEESKMPPKCCGQPVPSSIVKNVLNREEQHMFTKAVLIFSTPWAERIFCPNRNCNEFIPPTAKIDPKHPFEVICKLCSTRACSTCKQEAHPLGHDCPSDQALDAVLKMGEHNGWRRCYKCRTLVELTQGCTHITCLCKAEFCYICGAVWDSAFGCPNYCDGEDELLRRREEANLRASTLAAAQAEQAALRLDALQRTAAHPAFQAFRTHQLRERSRFQDVERKQKWAMWTRHGQIKLETLDRFADLQAKMVERHAKTAAHLEDRQVGAEMEMRASLMQSERSVNIRLRHMEAYCSGGSGGAAAAGTNGAGMITGYARIVTDRDRRLLAQQVSLRDDLARLHQSRINVLREKQAMQMELLLERQAAEVQKLARTQDADVEALESGFVDEEERFGRVWQERRRRLVGRWKLMGMVGAKKVANEEAEANGEKREKWDSGIEEGVGGEAVEGWEVIEWEEDGDQDQADVEEDDNVEREHDAEW